MNFTYIIGILDEVTQEPIHLIVTGEDELLKVMKIKPEHHLLSSVQNLGPCELGKDYLKEQEGKN